MLTLFHRAGAVCFMRPTVAPPYGKKIRRLPTGWITSVHLGLCWRTLVSVALKLISLP